MATDEAITSHAALDPDRGLAWLGAVAAALHTSSRTDAELRAMQRADADGFSAAVAEMRRVLNELLPATTLLDAAVDRLGSLTVPVSRRV
jgi:hypothetical protein